ncbi:hypothetical protein P8C59_006079 [Phyllachora maydis]|uniref:mRNA decay factor PAT1 domain-containing protein n=1 Tax=Phyllachora maydis TaxID=1825666 RepID=A0AAD9MF50_9PEZI|nr:hypothetical protein P8C59_006079 [Phyllachora maydis]
MAVKIVTVEKGADEAPNSHLFHNFISPTFTLVIHFLPASSACAARMSFFGFDSTRHDMAATGFSQPHDPFAGLSGQDNGGEALEFEDTYDGLGDNLDETDDAFNDDTFGGGTTTGKVGKDFDFFGQTAKVADAMEEEQVRFTRQLPVSSRVTLVTPAPAGMSNFYYQVLSQIQGGQRQHPSQPLNNFAQTYLYQTGNRHGGLRRHNRGPENHMQRMEQQVQRAVEAAKNKPKNKQLVIEGSLGKISFSNAKTPKPLLNIKRSDSANEAQRPSSANKASHAPSWRIMSAFIAWREEAQRLNSQLWAALRVHDVPEDDNVMHPFIALLTYPKGRKAMPRVFRQSSVEQKTTVLTLIIVSLDGLDVIRHAQVDTDNTNLNAAMREDIDSFSSLVMSTLFGFMNELDLDIIAGILGIMCSRNVHLIAKSRIGASMLTMILSRAEIIKHLNGGNEQAWRSWDLHFNQLFDVLERTLPHVFPKTLTTIDDVYVWQFLAALGIHASPEQQQRLVIAVKDRVMDTVTLAKTLPADMSQQRLANVNLFMRSIGLDVELLQ